MADKKVIVTIAPTGGMANKTINPNLPTQPEEIADDVYRCYNGGASIVAIHARRPDDQATCNPTIYKRINDLVRAKCDIVINNSTGGGVNGDVVKQGPNGYPELMWEERIKGMEAGAEMCTLDPTTIIATFEGRESPGFPTTTNYACGVSTANIGGLTTVALKTTACPAPQSL